MITDTTMNTAVFLLLIVAATRAHTAQRCTGENESYLEYKSCLLTCDDLEDYTCDGQASYDPGCYCSEGFLRQNGVCIPKDRCNTIADRYAKCPENEVFLKYPSCRESCGDTDHGNCEERQNYNPGCYCSPGYRRKNGVCIPKEKCFDLHTEQCGQNEVYMTFKPCLITCGDLISYKECSERQYAPGCYCKQGYLRKDGKCVPKEECLESRKGLLITCGLSEVHLKYAPCLQTCSDLERETCNGEARRYAPGCYCAEGYFRRNGICVSEEECLSVEPRDKRSEKCERNELYLEYEPCLQTCSDLASPKCAEDSQIYAPGCYCKEGYLRKDGVCIPKGHCQPHSRKGSKLCGTNEVFLAYRPQSENCGDHMEQKHDNEKRFAPGCYCYPGYLRRDGICIPEEECSKPLSPIAQCGVNEEYSEYEPCPQSCDDLESRSCKERSRTYFPGCFCTKGYLRKDGVCLPQYQCANFTGLNVEIA